MASSLMNIGTRALAAHYAGLQTTGHNIANAGVDGYSRQRTELATSPGQYTGAGFFGKGVDVQTVVREHDRFLTREAATARSLAEADRVRLEQLQRLEAVFLSGEAGIGHAAGAFLNAAVDLASRPQDLAARQVVLGRAAEVADRFAQAAGQVETLQAGVAEALRHTVDSVNGLARRIGEVNQQIAAVHGLGQPPNDLLDLRDRLVHELSGHLQVTALPAADGTVSVFVAGGQRLVLGAQASALVVTADPADPSRVALGIAEGDSVRVLGRTTLGGGAVAGLLRVQDEDLARARNALGQMAAAFALRVNEQQSFGLDLRVPPGAGAALFAIGAPQALPAATNARDAAGNFAASVSLAVVDPERLLASEYDLQPDPAAAGSYRLTRLSDGLVRSVASGSVVDGVRITVSGAAAGDRFRLQPVAQAALAMRRVLDDPRGLAAASPLSATLPLANTGTATLHSLRVVSADANAQYDADIAFSDASGGYDWVLRDRATSAVVSTGSGRWSADAPIALNGFELRLHGMPAAGDRVLVGATAQPASDNGNALALVGLRDERLVGRTTDAAGQPSGGLTVTDAWAGALAGVGVAVQGARTASDISGQVAHAALQQRDARAGVNLDEEAARLIQHQQSYQAAAKVLQVAQAVFETLIQTTAR